MSSIKDFKVVEDEKSKKEEQLHTPTQDELNKTRQDYGDLIDLFLSKYGEMDINVPQDRESSFEPQIVKKRQKDISSIDDKIMLISYINSKLDLIAYYKEIMANPKARKRYILQNTESQLNRFESELLHTKKYIMNYKIPEKKNELVA